MNRILGRKVLIACLHQALLSSFSLEKLQHLQHMLQSGELAHIFEDALAASIQSKEAELAQKET